ncbi:MAG TPA: molybdopterin cofactor-binding domain-containing protein, partial [Gammaproteobacteria bacterium]
MTTLDGDQEVVAGLSVTRRELLAGAGGLVFAISICPRLAEGADEDALELTAWVRLNADNTMTIFNPSAEMGQGAMTAMPLIIAEELDADWSLVDVEYSPIVREVYGRARRGGRSMTTTGSNTVSSFFMPLRRVGAQARLVLLQNAARHWNVPVSELDTEPSVVVHEPTGRRLTYGEIAEIAEIPGELPPIEDADLKNVRDFRLIGVSQPRRDIPAKVDGSARFAMDVQVPDMRYGMIERAPVHGSGPVSANSDAILALPGITDVVFLDHGVGIVGDSVGAVLQARTQLEIAWRRGAPAEGFDSDTAFAAFREIARESAANSGGQPSGQGRGYVFSGDVAGALTDAAKTYIAEYRSDHIYHAQMEPLNAVASVSPDGGSAEIWIGSQAPDDAGDAVAATLGIASDKVTVNQHFLGGGFGRRTINDEAVEAAELSRAAGTPVKLIWSREDDLRYGAFRPMSLQRLEAGVDENGELAAWRHHVIGDGDELQITGVDIPFYEIPNKDIRPVAASTGIRMRHWRAVGHGYNKFAIESFVDEI